MDKCRNWGQIKISVSLKASTLAFMILLITLPQFKLRQAAASSIPTRRVNVPYLGPQPPVDSFTPAIFWFGQVGPRSNYADVRVYYYDQYLNVVVHIIDRLLWYDTNPSAAALTEWDSVSVYLDLDGNSANAIDENDYQLVSQVNVWQADENWQAGFRGSGAGWVANPISFSAETTWRGNALNDNIDDKGWTVKFTIPFTSLALAEKPVPDTEWGLGVVVHDRDDAAGTLIPDKTWPESMEPNTPSTWGEMVFGIPEYDRPLAIPSGISAVRHGLDGDSVEDAHVGGHGNCGADTNYWQDWGDANYAGYSSINIQNQWDIADWPCFSKYYVTFPLDSIPTGNVILSATLTMHLFGNAGGGEWGEPPDSYIQVFTIGEDWGEATLTWNNAPLAMENISGAWVEPVQATGWPGWPGIPYEWDVSRAVAETILRGEPLRLALYSADGERHTGKYFSSSDAGDWNATARPTLRVIWGESCDALDSECYFSYLPLTKK